MCEVVDDDELASGLGDGERGKPVVLVDGATSFQGDQKHKLTVVDLELVAEDTVLRFLRVIRPIFPPKPAAVLA